MSGYGVGEMCYLILEDGTVFPGISFGAKQAIDGEVGKCNNINKSQ